MMDSENHGQEVLSCLIGHEHLFAFDNMHHFENALMEH